MKTIKKPFKVFAMTLAIPILAILCSPMCSYADDTAALQALLNAGPVTLPAGHSYSVTGLTVNYNLNLNGDVINMTAVTGTAIKLVKPSITLSNGTIQGTWSPTSASVTPAYTGIGIYGSGVTINNITVQNIQGYGMVCSGALNGLIITNNHIINTSYIGFYFDAENAATTGGVFSGNTVDRSQMPVANVHFIALGIRGSTSNGTITTGWTITNNVLKMPAGTSTIDATAACMELRYITNSTVSGNTFIGGSMGASILKTTGMQVLSNKLSGQAFEAIEYGDCNGLVSSNNVISSGLGVGTLLDGANGCNGINITNDNISGTKGDCIHAYSGTQNVSITGCTLITSTGAKAINLQKTNMVKILNTNLNGNGVGSLAIMLDTCPGNLTINGGTISNFTNCVVGISNTTSGLVTDYVTMSSVGVSGVPHALSTYVANGGAIGTHITVVNK
jgi:hypothetical protein